MLSFLLKHLYLICLFLLKCSFIAVIYNLLYKRTILVCVRYNFRVCSASRCGGMGDGAAIWWIMTNINTAVLGCDVTVPGCEGWLVGSYGVGGLSCGGGSCESDTVLLSDVGT